MTHSSQSYLELSIAQTYIYGYGPKAQRAQRMKNLAANGQWNIMERSLTLHIIDTVGVVQV
jgi:hypothetical protein